MKYIKTFEQIGDWGNANWRNKDQRRAARLPGAYSGHLLPVSIIDLPEMCKYFKKAKVDFDVYENGVKFLKATKMPFKIKDFLIYFEDSNRVDNGIKLRSLYFDRKSQISKWVGAKVKDIDLYINADKYNL